MTRAHTLTERLEAIHGLLADKMPGLARIAVVLYDPQTEMLHTLAHSSGKDDPLSHYSVPLKSVPSLKAMVDNGTPRVVDDIPASYASASEHSRRIIGHGYRSSYTERMTHRGQVLGFVFFNGFEPGMFSGRTLPVVECAARLVALTVGEDLDASRILTGAIVALGKVARVRDPETGAHLQRMSRFSREIAFGVAGRWRLDDEFIEKLYLSAPLHDIGKLAMPDAILLKPGPLDEREWQIMCQHPARGCEIVQIMMENASVPIPKAEILLNIIRHHHEHFDGTGYPDRLAGTRIPAEARIVAIADSFDALTTRRPYKDPWSNRDALDWIRAEAGRHFDPQGVAALADALPQVEAIQASFQDPDVSA